MTGVSRGRETSRLQKWERTQLRYNDHMKSNLIEMETMESWKEGC